MMRLIFSVYQFDAPDEEDNKFVITSNDLRIGEIIAICDGSFEDDISDNPAMQIVAAGLEDYINNTIEEYNSISNQMDTSRSSSNAHYFQSPEYKVTKSIANSGFMYNQVITKWNQDAPYNDCIKAIEGKAYPAGCGVVALAQLCTHWKYPKRCSDSVYNKIKSKWSEAAGWDGVYDYYNMKFVNHYEYAPYAEYLTPANKEKKVETKYGKMIENLSDEGRMNIGALMYDIGKNVNVTYSMDGSGVNTKDAINWLRSVGYNCSDECDYDFDKIKYSIDRGHPVYTIGYRTREKEYVEYEFLWWSWKSKKEYYYTYKNGHVWIIDDYANLTCTVEYTVDGKKKEDKFVDDLVHCNFGWGGKYNGYYLNGLFDLTNGAKVHAQDISDAYYNSARKIYDDEESKCDRNYQYRLTMVYDIY